MSETAILEAEGVTVRRNNHAEPVLDGLSLSVRAGEPVSISGPSGCGKSTLLWCLARLNALDAGEVYLRGEPRGSVPPAQWRRRVTLMPQTTTLLSGNALENILLPYSLHRFRRDDKEPPTPEEIRMEMDGLGLETIPLDHTCHQLSGGEAQRIAFLRTLLTRPECLLCDEPMSNLDEGCASKVLDRLRKYAAEGCGLILVRHGHDSPEGFRGFTLSGGRLVEGS